MKAPEKIYLQQYDEDTLLCLNEYNIHEEWTEKPCNQKIATNIEYIRADAFIKKASFWLECNLSDSSMEDRKFLVEDFVNHMKGE